MTSSEQGALLPALILLCYVLGGALVYWLSGSGGYRDEEMARRKTGATTKTVRVFFSWLMSPWLRLLLKAEIPASAVTSVSLAISLAAAVALAAGHFSLGGTIFVLASVCDYFDGRLARAQGGGTTRGAVLDSTIDRYSEAALLTGLSWYYRQSWVLLPALLALSGSLLVPYARAKAEALGVKLSDVGWLQRPERVAILGATTGLAPLGDALVRASWPLDPGFHWLTVVGLCVLSLGTQVTAVQRYSRLLGVLTTGEKAPRYRGPRTIAASAVATASDAALVAGLSGALLLALPLATALGCVAGAVVNFTLNRTWALRATGGKVTRQGGRYLVVSTTSVLFNSGGVAVMTLLSEVPGAASWLLVRGIVFVTWTYPLYCDYVFRGEPVEWAPVGRASS